MDRRILGIGNFQNRLGISRVSARDVFLPIARTIAIGIGDPLREQVVHCAKIAQTPGIRDAITIG